MRKSSLPSNLIKKKQNIEDVQSLIPKDAKINHLEIYDILLGKHTPKKEEEENSNANKENEEEKEDGPKVGTNVRMNERSRPIYYAVTWRAKGAKDKDAKVTGKRKSLREKDEKSYNEDEADEQLEGIDALNEIINNQKAKKKKEATPTEGYGCIKVNFDSITLFDLLGKKIAQTSLSRSDYSSDTSKQKVILGKKEAFIQEGFTLLIGSKTVKVGQTVSEEEFSSADFFMKDPKVREKEEKLKKAPKPKLLLAAARKPIKGAWVVPWKTNKTAPKKMTKPLHNPRAPGALVLYQPTDIFGENRVPVVVDPMLTKHLREHQRVGVQFLFNCVGMGFADPIRGTKCYGCILADDMGLGKTFQAITILWTLLKQGPAGLPICRKVVIVCPSSLVGNWCQELNQWLEGKIKPMPIGESSKTGLGKISDFQYKDYDVLVISYDQLKKYADVLKSVDNIDLVICDEGHKIKNAETKAAQKLRLLPTNRRIILSGTPIQNDLEEFFSMVDFINPGFLGDLKKFKYVFGDPIMKSRQKDASPEDKLEGERRSLRLTELTERFILRRTSQVNRQYLPEKMEHTVFVSLSPLQRKIYNTLCELYREKLANKQGADALPLITNLKKLCNSPRLIWDLCKRQMEEAETTFPVQAIMPHFKSEKFDENDVGIEQSGKLQFLDNLLAHITSIGDKTVIISNYTETLEVLADLCRERGYEFFQLDGRTVVKKRQALVNEFNIPSTPQKIFLLSSKAGGVGLNLVGANHLILFDPDWNPANDDQAMARCWRPGQKKKCYVYRILSTGSIEEKVYQRQVTKKALSKAIVEGDTETMPTFSQSELRRLFILNEKTHCETHDLLSCRCAQSLSKIFAHEKKGLSVDELLKWEHYEDMSKCSCEIMKKVSGGVVSFLFSKLTAKCNDTPTTDAPRKRKTFKDALAENIKEVEKVDTEDSNELSEPRGDDDDDAPKKPRKKRQKTQKIDSESLGAEDSEEEDDDDNGEDLVDFIEKDEPEGEAENEDGEEENDKEYDEMEDE